MRDISVIEQSDLIIHGYEAVSRVETLHGGPVPKQKVYIIFIDGWVYTLSTDSKELFGELDKIAKSFRYTP